MAAKRGYGGGRTYKSSSTMSRGNGLTSGKGGMSMPPGLTDTTKFEGGADPGSATWSGRGTANVKSSRLPGDGKPRR
jgi:hypothetical protein